MNNNADPAAGAALAERTRATQGLPTTVVDSMALTAIAAIAAGAIRRSSRDRTPATNPGPCTSSSNQPTTSTTPGVEPGQSLKETCGKHSEHV